MQTVDVEIETHILVPPLLIEISYTNNGIKARLSKFIYVEQYDNYQSKLNINGGFVKLPLYGRE